MYPSSVNWDESQITGSTSKLTGLEYSGAYEGNVQYLEAKDAAKTQTYSTADLALVDASGTSCILTTISGCFVSNKLCGVTLNYSNCSSISGLTTACTAAGACGGTGSAVNSSAFPADAQIYGWSSSTTYTASKVYQDALYFYYFTPSSTSSVKITIDGGGSPVEPTTKNAIAGTPRGILFEKTEATGMQFLAFR